MGRIVYPRGRPRRHRPLHDPLGSTEVAGPATGRRCRANPIGCAIDLCDYRDIDGHYDAVISVEMVEAVGYRSWPDFRHPGPAGPARVAASRSRRSPCRTRRCSPPATARPGSRSTSSPAD